MNLLAKNGFMVEGREKEESEEMRDGGRERKKWREGKREQRKKRRM
jgi:hypothetical protein